MSQMVVEAEAFHHLRVWSHVRVASSFIVSVSPTTVRFLRGSLFFLS